MSLDIDHDSARLGPDPTPGIGLSSASCSAYRRKNGVIVLSPSAGSSQRETGVKCIAMVSVPSGAAAARVPETHSKASTIRAMLRTRRSGLMCPQAGSKFERILTLSTGQRSEKGCPPGARAETHTDMERTTNPYDAAQVFEVET